MPILADFPITKRWPPQNPGVIQLYSLPTPNGVKASIALEELGLRYEAHKITLTDADVRSPEFRSLNPNARIPAIIDPNGPDGEPIGLFESGGILIYLAEKAGKLIPKGSGRYEVIQWVMFQMGGIGPFFGQLGYFTKFAGKEVEDPRPRQHYVTESARLLAVLEKSLQGRDWIAGEYSIADIAIVPWLRSARDYYKTGDLIGLPNSPNVQSYMDRFLARPAVQKGLTIPPRD